MVAVPGSSTSVTVTVTSLSWRTSRCPRVVLGLGPYLRLRGPDRSPRMRCFYVHHVRVAFNFRVQLSPRLVRRPRGPRRPASRSWAGCLNVRTPPVDGRTCHPSVTLRRTSRCRRPRGRLPRRWRRCPYRSPRSPRGKPSSSRIIALQVRRLVHVHDHDGHRRRVAHAERVGPP